MGLLSFSDKASGAGGPERTVGLTKCCRAALPKQSFSHAAENLSYDGEPLVGVSRSREERETGSACDRAGYEISTLPRLKQSDELKDQTCY
jgi:hypothetical protein